jgi:phosphoribosylaminoimidazole-succinocarboxamide synthase
MNGPDRVRARRFDVIREPGAIPRDAENFFVPLEVICRHYLAGSAWRRYERGEATAEEFGFEPGTQLKQGVKLPSPHLEVSTITTDSTDVSAATLFVVD